MQAAFFAYFHHVVVFALISTILIEFVLLHADPSKRVVQLLIKVDAMYGITAALVLAVGFARVYLFEKGSTYYFSSSAFQLKLGLFAIVGALSVYSTVQYIRWGKKIKTDSGFTPSEGDFKKLRKWKSIEIVLALPIPLFAALMARGLF